MAYKKLSERYATHPIGSSSAGAIPISVDDLVLIEDASESEADDASRVALVKDILIDLAVEEHTYIAYASDNEGTDFTNTFDPDLEYIAILNTTDVLDPPIASDFAGLWCKYKGTDGTNGTNAPTFTISTESPDNEVGENGDFWAKYVAT